MSGEARIIRTIASRIDAGAVAGCRALLDEAARRGYPLPRLVKYHARGTPAADWIMRVALGLAARSHGWSYRAMSAATAHAISEKKWMNWRHNVSQRLLPAAIELAGKLADAVADDYGPPEGQCAGSFDPLRIPVDPVRAAVFGSPLVRRFDDDPRAIAADRTGTPPRAVTWPGGAHEL